MSIRLCWFLTEECWQKNQDWYSDVLLGTYLVCLPFNLCEHCFHLLHALWILLVQCCLLLKILRQIKQEVGCVTKIALPHFSIPLRLFWNTSLTQIHPVALTEPQPSFGWVIDEFGSYGSIIFESGYVIRMTILGWVCSALAKDTSVSMAIKVIVSLFIDTGCSIQSSVWVILSRYFQLAKRPLFLTVLIVHGKKNNHQSPKFCEVLARENLISLSLIKRD